MVKMEKYIFRQVGMNGLRPMVHNYITTISLTITAQRFISGSNLRRITRTL